MRYTSRNSVKLFVFFCQKLVKVADFRHYTLVKVQVLLIFWRQGEIKTTFYFFIMEFLCHMQVNFEYFIVKSLVLDGFNSNTFLLKLIYVTFESRLLLYSLCCHAYTDIVHFQLSYKILI